MEETRKDGEENLSGTGDLFEVGEAPCGEEYLGETAVPLLLLSPGPTLRDWDQLNTSLEC